VRSIIIATISSQTAFSAVRSSQPSVLMFPYPLHVSAGSLQMPSLPLAEEFHGMRTASVTHERRRDEGIPAAFSALPRPGRTGAGVGYEADAVHRRSGRGRSDHPGSGRDFGGTMGSITINRTDLFPVGVLVGVWPRAAQRDDDAPTPPGPIASAKVTAKAGGPTARAVIAHPLLDQGGRYVAHAEVDGENRYLNVSIDR
jgi:hypothetical protein